MDTWHRLVELPSACVERLDCCRVTPMRSAERFSADFKISYAFRGVFLWHVAGRSIVGDANQVLFVRGGDAFRISAPRPGETSELVVTPSYALLSELTEAAGRSPEKHPLFEARRALATPRMQRRSAELLHRATYGLDRLAAEEEIVEFLRSVLASDLVMRPRSLSTRRIIRRTKEFLDAHFMEPRQLGDVARAVGVSPAYLTDVFRRFEGASLWQYVTRLRLARALVELPHTDDLTDLALRLGFSSHSHFTLAFRRAFGCTPSAFRRMTSAARTRQVMHTLPAAAGARKASAVTRSARHPEAADTRHPREHTSSRSM